MASNPKSRSKAKAAKAKGSALNSEQEDLREQERKVQEEIAKLQRAIDEAPQRAAEERRRSQQAVFAATPRKGAYLHGASMLDTRHVEAAAALGRIRRSDSRKRVVLREERTAGRRQTLVLIVVLVFAICWALSHYL